MHEDVHFLPAGDGADDQEGLVAAAHGTGKGSVGGLVRQVATAREESDERPASPARAIANGPAKNGETFLERIEHRCLRCIAIHVESHLGAFNTSERAQV